VKYFTGILMTKLKTIFIQISTLVFLISCTTTNNKNTFPIFLNPSQDMTMFTNGEDGDLLATHDIALSKQMEVIWGSPASFLVSKYDENIPLENRKKTVVNSCKKMISLFNAGYQSESSYGVYVSRYIDCKVLEVSLSLLRSHTSYVNNFKLDLNNIKMLPKNMAFMPSTSGYFSLMNDVKLKTLQDAVFSKNTKMIVGTEGRKGIEGEYFWQMFSIEAKGDFNHDGIEDIVIKVNSSANGGRYVSHALYVLTKTKKEGNWVVLGEYPNIISENSTR